MTSLHSIDGRQMYCSGSFATSVLRGGGWSEPCPSSITPKKLSVPTVWETGLCICLLMYKILLLWRIKLAGLKQMYHLFRMPQTTTNLTHNMGSYDNPKIEYPTAPAIFYPCLIPSQTCSSFPYKIQLIILDDNMPITLPAHHLNDNWWMQLSLIGKHTQEVDFPPLEDYLVILSVPCTYTSLHTQHDTAQTHFYISHTCSFSNWKTNVPSLRTCTHSKTPEADKNPLPGTRGSKD